MAMHPSELEALMRDRLDPTADIKDMTDDGGHGLVRWSRTLSFRGGHTEDGTGTRVEVEHIVHRWAVKDTDGVERWPEGHFYNGGYHPTEEQARTDYRSRP